MSYKTQQEMIKEISLKEAQESVENVDFDGVVEKYGYLLNDKECEKLLS